MARKGKNAGTGAIHVVVGVGGVAFTVAGVLGLLHSLEPQQSPAPPPGRPVVSNEVSNEVENDVETPPAGDAPVVHAAAVESPPEQHSESDSSFYPLEVGHYWVYGFHEGNDDVNAEIVRTIERRERREGRELYYFDDGTVVYKEGGRIFEMGTQGVNVVPMEPRAPQPYIYTSQGMVIEKHIGATDTAVVASDRRFDGCLEVITRFRSVESGPKTAMSYSSYYAPGIGLVGRERWTSAGAEGFSLELRGHGVKMAGSLAEKL